MKKVLLFVSVILPFALIYGQVTNPCIRTADVINNGNGTTVYCTGTFPGNGIQSANSGFKKQGELRVSFTHPLPSANSAPVILSVTDLQGNPVLDPKGKPINVRFVWEPASGNRTSSTVLAYYCYYSDNGNLFNGSGAHYLFTIQYPSSPTQTCDVINTPPSTLPVLYTFFTAKRTSSRQVTLNWQTAQELNSSGFEVQRQIGSGSWQVIAFIPSQAMKGTSTSPLTYTYVDNNNANGVTQYRLRQIDIDGNSEFSVTRSVVGEGQGGKMIVYPNPSNTGKVQVVFEAVNGTRDAVLTDVSGRVVKQWSAVTNNNLQIENMTSGYYNLRVILRETGEQTIQQIIVSKK